MRLLKLRQVCCDPKLRQRQRQLPATMERAKIEPGSAMHAAGAG